MLTGTETPLLGAPGAVILYALAAVLLWADRERRLVLRVPRRAPGGSPVAKGPWLVLRASMSYYALLPTNRSAKGLHDLFSRAAQGAP
ncbi:MAG TPA: hypothetical protein VMF60_01155, partial [Acidimicrobiales bacterium]|nr:hypothetical protein [Acidimicrobiales bacterium]